MPDLDKFQSNNERNCSMFKEARQKNCVCLKGLFIPYNTSDLMKWFSIIAPRKNNFRKDINSKNEWNIWSMHKRNYSNRKPEISLAQIAWSSQPILCSFCFWIWFSWITKHSLWMLHSDGSGVQWFVTHAWVWLD